MADNADSQRSPISVSSTSTLTSLKNKRDTRWRGTPELSMLRVRQYRDVQPPGKRGTRVEKNSRVKPAQAWAVQGWDG